ncbi:MAG: DUF1616 domain-containing protein [Candidatus Thermoplasmatota archaeon]|nr:DUF1616 domain-containing protein [Candidatus Thermoplasmatota archaeon]
MRVEIRKKPYDLYGIIAVSTLLVIVILVNELSGIELQALRVVLGLPFILFFPGYMLISALYPEKKKYFDKDGEPTNPPSSDDDEETPEDENTKGKGLDGLERVALSLGLSIAITPLIGLVLNWTYEWDPDHLGIRLVPILVSQYAFILIAGMIAVRRRLGVPMEDRFAIVIDLSIPEDYTKMDKLLTVGIVVMMVLSVGMLIYIIVVPREGEAFTEFYILGANNMADEYPRNFHLDEEQLVYIGIGNHEHRNMNYSLVMSIDPAASNRTVAGFDHVTVSRGQQPLMGVMVPDGKTSEIQVNFSILEVGAYKLRFLLFVDGDEYRDLHLWVKVFEEGYLVGSSDPRIEMFAAGPGGDQSSIPGTVSAGEPAVFSIGLRNIEERNIDLNLTISIGSVSTWHDIKKAAGPVNITTNTGAYLDLVINSTSSLGPVDMLLSFEKGTHKMVFRLRGEGIDLRIEHSVEVL